MTESDFLAAMRTMALNHQRVMNDLAIREQALKVEKAEWECRTAEVLHNATRAEARRLALPNIGKAS